MRYITSGQHALVKHLVKLRQNRDYRYEHQTILVEGIKVIHEIASQIHFKLLVVQQESLLPKNIQVDDVIVVPEHVMQKISGMQKSEGILAEIAMPMSANLTDVNRLLVLDGVSDPGNIGSLLRTALALGWEGVFLLENSCDPFNEKVIRAARGATFKLPIAWGSWEQLKLLQTKLDLKAYMADLHGTPLHTIQTSDKMMLILGNEAVGVSNEAKLICKALTIPMTNQMESLNVAVAGAIMMYELGKK